LYLKETTKAAILQPHMQHINNSRYDVITNNISATWRIRCDLHKLNYYNQDTTKAAISGSQRTISEEQTEYLSWYLTLKVSFKYTISSAKKTELPLYWHDCQHTRLCSSPEAISWILLPNLTKLKAGQQQGKAHELVEHSVRIHDKTSTLKTRMWL